MQRRTDPEAMLIEDASVIWNEEAAPFETVATITVPDQAFDTDAATAACEASRSTRGRRCPNTNRSGA